MAPTARPDPETIAKALQRVRIHVGDIATLEVDAIVNAANGTLMGGGGVDGAIHRAAGPELKEACRPLGGCDTGDAKTTPGFRLPARHVIHTVGPVWHGGEYREEELLTSCYRRCMEEARKHGVGTLAFPAISTGAFRFPPRRAADIALETVAAALAAHDTPREVVMVCFDAKAEVVMRTAYARLTVLD